MVTAQLTQPGGGPGAGDRSADRTGDRTGDRLKLDPELTGLAGLGVERSAQLLGAEPWDCPRLEVLEPAGGNRPERLRFPLPGTPDRPGGAPTGLPAGSGTGWVVLERWHAAAWFALLRARFTQPPSASLAERHWNLLCHLRAHGVGTPEPLCVGARGAGVVSRSSFLVTRELEDYEPLADWLARETRPLERALGLFAVGAMLAKLLGAGVQLPELGPEHLFLSEIEAEEGSCSFRATPLPDGLTRNRLPSVVLTNVRGGSLRRLTARDAARLLDRLDARGLALEVPERRRILSRALRGTSREFRRNVLRSLLDRRAADQRRFP